MNNYYEILEVSKNASKEIIEKAYKVLAKKYHPDLQEESNKKVAEEKMKLINEAYEILSDDSKREEYDRQLEYEEDINKNDYQNYNNSDIYEEYYEYEQPLTKEQIKEQKKQEKKAQKKYKEEQEREYINYMRSLGYRVKERWTLKKLIKLLECIAIVIIVVLVIWFFPPTHKLLVDIYEQNPIIKAIVDIFINSK